MIDLYLWLAVMWASLLRNLCHTPVTAAPEPSD
jgi:hypothetical protein